MTILKVQFNDEIRRVTIEDDCDLTELTSKVRYMFPQLRNFVISYFVPSSPAAETSNNTSSWVEIKSNEDLSVGVLNAKLSVPPVFRICIKPVDEPIQPLLLESPEPVPVVTTTTVVSLPFCSTCEQNEAAYKCINCYNLELCNSCEGSHDSNHLLIKMKNFNAETIDSLPLKQQLIFTQHVDNFPSETAKAECKARSKTIRSAIREACNTRKQQHRKSKACKSSKTAATEVSVAATVEVVDMEPCQTAVIEMAPQIVQLEEMVDPLPQPIVPEDDEKVVVVVVSEVQPQEQEVKEEEEEVKEQEQEEEVIEQPEQEEEEEEEGEGWNLMSRINGWRRGGNREENGNSVDEREYRIQGIGFWEKMEKLEKMGFEDRSKNMLLLAKNLCNLEKTVEDLTC